MKDEMLIKSEKEYNGFGPWYVEIESDVDIPVHFMNHYNVDRDIVMAYKIPIGKEQARAEGKPEAMLDKIAQGRLNKFYQESTLLEQAFIKDAKITVQQYLQQQNAGLTATDFKRVTLNQE